MPSRVFDEIIYPFPYLNGVAFEFWEWISDFTPHFITDVYTYAFSDCNQAMLVKVAPGCL